MRLVRRIAPGLVAAVGLLVMGERLVLDWANRPAPAAAVAGVAPLPAAADCLPRDAVLAALAARGLRAHPEAPPFCTAPAGLPQWFALDPVGPDGTHLAFDAAGCLALWSPVPCPPP